MKQNQKILPQVSVIVPIYNGQEDLPDLINCIQEQTYPKDKVEYLLVNNNSQDDTSKILNQATLEAKKIGINLQVLNENNIQSSYAARNQGIRQAKGEILAFTDADCRPLNN